MENLKRSTALVNYQAASGSLKGAMDGCVFYIYGSTSSASAAAKLVPDSADDSIGDAELLCTVSVDGEGTGVSFADSADAGVLSKDTDETWTGEYTATGYPSFFRMASTSDTGAEDTANAYYRIQGTVGTSASYHMIITSALKTSGDSQAIKSCNISFPLS